MKNSIWTVLASAGIAALIATSVEAQATRTWVSGVGDDANPCSRTAPCKTFAGAISKTAAGGEISTLDPGGFGAVTITKSITINGDGTLAGILGSLTNGVTVNAAATDRVVLRSLSLNGAGNGLSGIRFIGGQSLVVENCTISGFATRAIDVSLTDGVGLVLRSLTLKNVTMTHNGAGIRLANTSVDDFLRVTLDNSAIVSNTGIGFEAFSGTSRTVIKSSMIAHNNNDGVKAGNAGAEINLEDTVVSSNNGNAIHASASGARIRLSQNTITNNTAGLTIAAGATIESAGNNRVAGNGASAAPNGTYTQQ